MKLWELLQMVDCGTRIEIHDRRTDKLLARTVESLDKFTACDVLSFHPAQKVEKYTGGTMVRPYLYVWVGMPED